MRYYISNYAMRISHVEKIINFNDNNKTSPIYCEQIDILIITIKTQFCPMKMAQQKMEAQISHLVIIKQECEEYNSNINSNANSDNKVISNKK